MNKFIIVFLFFTACGKKTATVVGPAGTSCTVTSQTGGALITCTDGSMTFVGNGSDGVVGEAGPVGETGASGSNGLSVYDLWLLEGNVGTVQDFLNSLVGKTGPQGEAGNSGNDGLSAYDLWLNAGNSGSISDFLNSIVGLPGARGESGEMGPAGPQGNSGADGVSCGVTQLANGALITCGASSAVVLNGLDGLPGQDALSGMIGISELLNPCGSEFAHEEVLLKLSTGQVLAVYDGGPHLDRLSLLVPGTLYSTTDTHNNVCQFSINEEGNLN